MNDQTSTSEERRIAEIEARRNLEGCPAHTDCLRADIAYLLAALRKRDVK